MLNFERRAPRFEGALTLAATAGPKRPAGAERSRRRGGWRPRSRPIRPRPNSIRSRSATAPRERALKFAGIGGCSLRRIAAAACRADRRGSSTPTGSLTATNSAAEPIRLLPGLRALIGRIPQPPIPDANRVQCRADHAGRAPVADHRRRSAFRRQVLDHRPPGFSRARHHPCRPERRQRATPVRPAASRACSTSSRQIRTCWWRGCRAATMIAYRSQKPLHLRGVVSVTSNRLAIDALRAEIDGGAVEGRVALADRPAGGGTRLDAELKAGSSRSRCRHYVRARAGRPAGRLAGRGAAVAGYRPRHLRRSGAAAVHGEARLQSEDDLARSTEIRPGRRRAAGSAGNFDRVNATGELALNSSAASFGQITAMIEPLAPAVALRLDSMGIAPGTRWFETDARRRQECRTRRSGQRARRCRS